MTPDTLHHFRGLAAAVLFLIILGACSNVSRKDSTPMQPSSPETEPSPPGRDEPPVEIYESSSQRASRESSTEIAHLAIYLYSRIQGLPWPAFNGNKEVT